MKTVWKFHLNLNDRPTVLELPRGAEVLTVQMQHDRLTLWVLVDPEQPKESRTFTVHGTGHPTIPEHYTKDHWCGTVVDGMFVWHVFEKLQRSRLGGAVS